MTKNVRKFFLPLISLAVTSTVFSSTPSKAAEADIGSKGAEIYCFMRQSGNQHEVSWNASYELIKRQKSSLFKTSPKHAAVMIIEAVVANPANYANCGSYLGDLFTTPEIEGSEVNTSDENTSGENETPGKDRYAY